jgi:UDP-N-acetylglucosamine enolpyruvyl transferase
LTHNNIVVRNATSPLPAGVKVHVGAAGPGSVIIDAGALSSTSPDMAAVQALRASFFAAGPILARMGEVHMPLPGRAVQVESS